MEKIKIFDADLYIIKNPINEATYVNVNFLGGKATQTCPQLAHICEHLIMGKLLINNKLVENKYMGVHNSDARTRFDHLEFTFSVLTFAQLKERLLTIAKMLRYANLTNENLEKEKLIIEEELYSYQTLSDEDILKYKKALKSISLEMIKDYINRNLTTANLEIAIVSNLKSEILKFIVEEFYKELPTSKMSNKNLKLDFNKVDEELKSSTGHISKLETASTNKNFILPTKLNEKQKIMLDILIYFNNNFRIGLKKPLRHKKQLAYRTKSGLKEDDGKTLFTISIVHKPENREKVEKELNIWFERLSNKGLTAKEFNLAKFNLKMNKLKQPGLIQPMDIRNILIDYKYNNISNADEIIMTELIKQNAESLENFNKQANDQYLKLLDSITLDDFNFFIKKILNPNKKVGLCIN